MIGQGVLKVTSTSIFSEDEIQKCVDVCKGKIGRKVQSAYLWLVNFRLYVGCGLRCCEATGLQMRDVMCFADRPYIRIRNGEGFTKGRMLDGRTQWLGRDVPLWWDAGTLADIQAHYVWRESHGASGTDWFMPQIHNYSKRMLNRASNYTLKALMRASIGDRATHLNPLCGRHTFATYSLHRGRNMREVANAMGHKSISMLTNYVDLIESNTATDLFPRLEPETEPEPEGKPDPELIKLQGRELSQQIMSDFEWLKTAPKYVVPNGYSPREWISGKSATKNNPRPQFESLIG